MGDEDRRLFLKTLEEACGKSHWQVRVYCLLSNHFHLVVETPEPTLVAGMKWMRGTYTQRFNARHRMRGRPFAGRYKALLVDETEGNDLDAQRNRVPAACRKLEITGERALSKCVNMNDRPPAGACQKVCVWVV